MRRDIHWKIEHEDSTICDVRVSYFGGRYKFQFRESAYGVWEYDRRPTHDDLQMLLSIIQRRFKRQQAGLRELKESERLLRESSTSPSGG